MENKYDIKLVALDMDGTLLNDQDEISQENRDTIKEAQAKGVHVIVSTGRSLFTSREHVKSLELASYHITVNGSEVWDKMGGIVERVTVDSKHIQWLWELSKQYQVKIWANSTSKVWRREMPEEIGNHTWLKFGFEIPEDDVRNSVLKQLQTREQFFEISNSSPINIEVNARGVNKAKAIETVCKRLGISMSKVMAVGDSLNDISMIQAAGLGVAMGNAQDSVKEAANWVTRTNNDDGVALAIQKWVLS